MSYILSAGILVLGIALVILAVKLLHGLLKTAATAFLILLVLSGATFAALYQDYRTVQSGLGDDAVLEFTYANDTVSAVNITAGSPATTVAQDHSAALTIITTYEAYSAGDFTYDGETLDTSTTEAILGAETLTDVGDALRLRGDERTRLRREYDAAQAFKDQLVLFAAQSAIEDSPNRFLLAGLRSGTITVEPPLLTTFVINYVPGSVIDSAWNQVS
jgi:hypothetical protein